VIRLGLAAKGQNQDFNSPSSTEIQILIVIIQPPKVETEKRGKFITLL
jgi:hypothetical protein